MYIQMSNNIHDDISRQVDTQIIQYKNILAGNIW